MKGRLRFTALTIALTLTCGAVAADLGPVAFPAQITSSSSDAIVVNFNSSSAVCKQFTKSERSYETYTIPTEGATYEYGRPILPAVSRMVVVPADAGLALEVTSDEPERIQATQQLVLCDDSLLQGGEVTAFKDIYPSHIAEMSEPFIIRGVRLVKVTVFPIQYDPATNTYLRRDNIQASVRFTNDEPVNPAEVPIRKYRSREFLKVMEAMAINGDEVGRDDPPGSESPYVGHYLVAAHNATLGWNNGAVRRWIEFRRKTGYKVDIYSVASNDAGNPQTVTGHIRDRYMAYRNAGIDPFDLLLIVGDRQYTQAGSFNAENYITPHNGTSIWANPPHADYLFACLEGGNNDEHPDVGYSRMPSGSQDAAAMLFGRTLAYEETPRMEHPEWFTHGVNYSQHWGNTNESAWHISIHTNARWGEEVLKSLGFDDVDFYELTDWDQSGGRIGPWMAERYNEGINVAVGRAEIYYWNGQFQGVNANTVFPIDICFSGHGEWTQETIFRNGGANPNQWKGPVARTCAWGWPTPGQNNYIWMSMVNGVLQRDIPLGWSYTLALNSIETVMPNFAIPGFGVNLYPQVKTDTECWGDAGIQPWIGVPRLVEVTVPDSIPASTKMVEAFVHVPNSQDPVPGARVTFYASGNMPANNQNNAYANYTDFLMKTTFADSNGIARFFLEDGEELINNDTLFISASGRDIRPFIKKVRIRNATAVVQLTDWALSEQAGNGDDVINAGESFGLTLTAKNTGARNVIEQVSAHVESFSPFLEVVDGADLWFGDINADAEQQGDGTVSIRFAPSTPDGVSLPRLRPSLDIVFSSGDRTWKSGILFDPVAPNLELQAVVGGLIIPDSVANLVLDIKNIGSMVSPDVSVELRSLGLGVTVINNQSTLGAISPDEHARIEQPFVISGNKVVVPGSMTPMAAIFRTESGYLDTTFFSLQVMRERQNAPTGPDNYGYICFDNSDTDWDMAPIYEWIEIDPRAQNPDFEGTRMDSMRSGAFDIGSCQVIDLGFETQFYGEIFSQITIATNGFISMGAQPRITNYQNWRMDQAIGGGVGMLAPYWDDLRYDNNSGIYYYHDEANGYFIVEWSKAKLASGGGNNEITFQVIIRDRATWITESGDQNIVFQYKTITTGANIRNGDTEWVNNIAYGSVGISSPRGNSGLNYYFENDQPVSAAPLENRRALLFSTSPKYKACVLYGRVMDARTGAPVDSAIVFTEHGFVAYTDADGYWRIQDALAEVPFDITARKLGYNDSVYVDQQVAEGDSSEFYYDLLHPEFTPSNERLGMWLDPGFVREIPFTLYNGGNGPLTWSVDKRLLGDANASPWEMRRTYAVGDSADDDRIEGVVFANEHFYFSGANGTDSSMIYVVDRNYALIDSFPQPTHTRYGMKDLEWDGTLLWGSGDTSVYGFTPQGELVTTFHGPFNPTNNIAWDTDLGVLWVSGTTTNIIACDQAGNHVDTLARHGLRIYGLAYWPEDPDGYCLYILDSPGGQSPPLIHKMNTATGDTLRAYTCRSAQGSTGLAGLWITNEYDVYSWVLMANQNIPPASGSDRLDIYQLDARKDWFNLDVWNGVLDPEGVQDFTLTLNTTGLPDTTFEGELRFTHNAAGGQQNIGVTLKVIGPMAPDPFNLIAPANGDTIVALPLHGDTLNVPVVQFAWDRAHDPNVTDSLTYLLFVRAGVETVRIAVADTSISLNLDTLGLPIWFDTPINWWVSSISGSDTIQCLQNYYFNIIPNAIDRNDLNAPVKFGLQDIFPSPFNSRTSITFGADRAVRTTLKAYDLLGREVGVLFDRTPEVGVYRVAWDAGTLASGVYIIRLESTGRREMRKIALVR